MVFAIISPPHWRASAVTALSNTEALLFFMPWIASCISSHVGGSTQMGRSWSAGGGRRGTSCPLHCLVDQQSTLFIQKLIVTRWCWSITLYLWIWSVYSGQRLRWLFSRWCYSHLWWRVQHHSAEGWDVAFHLLLPMMMMWLWGDNSILKGYSNRFKEKVQPLIQLPPILAHKGIHLSHQPLWVCPRGLVLLVSESLIFPRLIPLTQPSQWQPPLEGNGQKPVVIVRGAPQLI